jgi:hypothetical protein
MSEQVQVREGVWRTRDGREIAIRARDFGDSEPTPWCWCSESTGEFETWRNDGWNTFSYRYHKQPLDLIEYLRPLPGTEAAPEQQTTTDTLTQIEGQIDQEQPWERLAVALQQQLTESLADRDRLQQQVATTTAERDILAQRLWVKPSEEFLQKQVSRQQIEVNTLKDRLGDMTTDRDQSARELFRVTADRDGLLQLRDRLQETLREQRQAIEAARAVQQQLAAMTSDRDRLAGELANAQQLAADLRGEVDFVRTQKTAQEHQLRAAIARLQRELQQARIDLEAERQVPRSEIAIGDATFAGFTKGKAWAFREVCDWLRPFVGADAKDAAALLDAVPGLVKRLAQCEGVEV